MLVKELTLKLHYEGDHIWAEVKELPGCFASGADLDELREALEEALAMCLSGQPGQVKVTLPGLNPTPATHKAHVRAQLVPC